MQQAEFEAGLRRDGYEVRPAAGRAPNDFVDDHAHGFDARLLILEGALTIGRESGEHTFGPGEVCDVPAGHRHTERTGPEGVRYLAGRRAA